MWRSHVVNFAAMTEHAPPSEESSEPGSGSRKISAPILLLALVAIGAGLFLIFGRGCVGQKQVDEVPIASEQLQRYQKGDIFRTIVNTTVEGMVENKDWGFKGAGTFIYQSELDSIREVTDVQGQGAVEVTMDLHVRRARDLQLAFDLGDVALDLPPIVGNRLHYVVDRIPPGPEKLTIMALKQKWFRGRIINTLESVMEKVNGPSLGEVLVPEPPTVQGFEGAGGEFRYRGGEGLVNAETRGNLSPEDEKLVKEFSVFAESHILPAPDENGPTEWDVDVRDIAHLLVPTAQVEVSGKLRFRRGEKRGDIQRLDIIKGLVQFNGETGASDEPGSATETLGSWAARGYLDYSLTDNTVVKGLVSGDVKIEKASTDHILFEARWQAEPSYHVTIFGFSAETREEAERDIEPVDVE